MSSLCSLAMEWPLRDKKKTKKNQQTCAVLLHLLPGIRAPEGEAVKSL